MNKSIHEILQFCFLFRSEGKDKQALISTYEKNKVLNINSFVF